MGLAECFDLKRFRPPVTFETRTALKPSDALVELLGNKLDSFEKLELVLVLRESGRPMPLVDVARRLQIGDEVFRRVAADVAEAGLIEISADDVAVLRVVDGEAEILGEAARLYAADPTKMVRLLSTIAFDRIRSLSARTFADAFRLRKR